MEHLLVVSCQWSVGQWALVDGSAVSGSVEDLSVGHWLVVGGQWFCNTPVHNSEGSLC